MAPTPGADKKEAEMKPQAKEERAPASQSDAKSRDMPFIRQVDDHSLPAAEVLQEQRRALDRQLPAPSFIP
jgi:hypothetical protein